MTARRRTAKEYLVQLRTLARERGGRLESPRYLGDAVKLRWSCAEGHRFELAPTSAKQGRWCRACGIARRAAAFRAPTEARLRRVVTRHGGRLLSPRYLGNTTPLSFRCAAHHEWTMPPARVLAGYWCRRCAQEARVAAALRRARRMALGYGITVVDLLHVRYQYWVVLRCGGGHEWRRLLYNLSSRSRCPTCERRSYLERLRRWASDRGGELLSGVYRGSGTPVAFRCAEGHRFVQRPDDLKQGKWCPWCGRARAQSGARAEAERQLRRLVQRRRGAILSPAYVNSQTRMRFRCAAGHEWETIPNSLLRGSWCRRCMLAARPRTSPGEVRARRSASRQVRALGARIEKPGYRNAKTPLQLVCDRGHPWSVLPGNLARGSTCPRCREDARLAELRAHAARWGGTFAGDRCPSTRSRLQWRCPAGHVFMRTGQEIKVGIGCPFCRGLQEGSIERMRRLARARGGACLSERYVDARTKLRWRCREGHEWEAYPGSVVQGRWCHTCRWRGGAPRLTLEDMRATAAERGGRCLSTEYHGNKVRLLWRCARGHEWMAHPNRVRQGSWCPNCAHAMRGTLDAMRGLAIERGGRCLTRAWDDHTQPLRFECARGHAFVLTRGAIKSGAWCPRCAPPRRTSAILRA